MRNTDHYATLGLDRRCTAEQVRNAYRLLVKRHHPDLHGNSREATEQAQMLNVAHETLSDAGRRRAYDRELTERERRPEVEDRNSARPKRVDRNISQDVHLDVEDFIRGVSLEVKVNDPANSNGPENYVLAVPEETAPGTRFRLAREEPFAGGFVLVRLKVRPGYRFKARGSDLRSDLRISASRATQGGTENIPGPSGRMVRVQIPAGVARNAILRVAGEGLPKSRGGRGDLLVRVTYRPEVKVTRTGRTSSWPSAGGLKRLS